MQANLEPVPARLARQPISQSTSVGQARFNLPGLTLL